MISAVCHTQYRDQMHRLTLWNWTHATTPACMSNSTESIWLLNSLGLLHPISHIRNYCQQILPQVGPLKPVIEDITFIPLNKDHSSTETTRSTGTRGTGYWAGHQGTNWAPPGGSLCTQILAEARNTCDISWNISLNNWLSIYASRYSVQQSSW